MPRKIKSCQVCRRGWTLEQWRALPLLAVHDDDAEERQCPCGVPHIVDVAHLETLDLRLPLEMALAKVERARLARMRSDLWRNVFAVAALVAMALVAWLVMR